MTTKKLVALLGGVGCAVALQACAVGADGTEESIATVEGAVASSVTITNDWGSGYCANVTVGNNMAVAANKWTVVLDMKGASIQVNNGAKNMWNALSNGTTGSALSFTPVSYNSYIQPGATASFGFCANGYNRPAMVGYNTTATQYAQCSTSNGLNPTRAALAVAMATELGRWKPEVDLAIGWDGKVALTSTGLSMCSNGCANTKAILGQQDDAVSGYVGQELFSATNFREDMKASFNRTYTKIDDLTRNNPGALPPQHKLTLVGGPTNMGLGSCGPHYIYKATDLNNNPLTSTQAANLANALCFYGQGSCGQNPYIAFVTTTQGCPSGQTCVAIDPEGYDNTTTSTTTAGSLPTYPMNRAWDPMNTLLNTGCIKSSGGVYKMQSKCANTPSSCGYLYCM